MTRLLIAQCHERLGNLDQAELWFPKSQQPVKAVASPSLPSMMAMVRAIIACRTGHPAYACAATGDLRNQGVVERIVGDMKPRYAGEFSFLGSRWPHGRIPCGASAGLINLTTGRPRRR